MAAQIAFPAGINGITEVGIAANVDEITDPALFLKIATKVRYQEATKDFFRHFGVETEKTCAEITGALSSMDLSSVVDEMAFRAQLMKDLSSNPTKKVKNAAPFKSAYAVQVIESHDTVVDLEKTLLINAPPVQDAVASSMWNAFIALTVSNGWYPKKCRYVQVLDEAASAAAQDARTIAEVNADGFFDMQKGATLIASTKVSWWLTNHHVGQTETSIESFAGKTYRAFETGADVVAARKVLWAAGKWNSTISWVGALGITGLKGASDDDSTEPITQGGSTDVTMRMRSRPAGAAEPTTYLAIYSHAVRSVFSVLVPPVDDIADIKVLHTDILKRPAAYHMGSTYLTGHPRIAPPALLDSTKENLSGYIHAAAPTGTLAKAKVIIPRSEVEGNMVFSTIVSVKAQLAATASATASLAMVAALRGGGATASIAVVEKRITQKAIDEAVAEAKVREEAEAAARAAAATVSGP